EGACAEYCISVPNWSLGTRRRKETIWFVISAPRRQTLSSRAAQSARDLTMFEVVKELCAILGCAQDDSDGKTFVVSPPFSPIHVSTRSLEFANEKRKNIALVYYICAVRHERYLLVAFVAYLALMFLTPLP